MIFATKAQKRLGKCKRSGIFASDLKNRTKMKSYLTRLEETTKRDWDLPALANYHGEVFAYKDIATYIAKFHIFFEAAGIAKGDKVALCARNTARWGISFLSINTYEAVVVPLLSDFTTDSLQHLVNHSDAVMLFTDTDMFGKMDISTMPALKAVVSVSDFTLLYAKDEDIHKAFDSIPETFNSRYPMGFSRENVSFPSGNDKDIAVINYTSGTTSAPKGVMLRYECFSAMVEFSIENNYVDSNDSMVSILPMGHIYGLMFEFIYPLCFGCTVYFFGKTPSPTLLMKAMAEVRPFMIAAVPLVMEKIYKTALKPVLKKWYMKIILHIPIVSGIVYRKIGKKLEAAFGGRVRLIILGGAALAPEVDKVFKKIRLPYTVGYGMTEASPLLAYEHWTKYVPGSCGKVVSCAEIRIDSEDPLHIAGEIQAKGMNICSGYYKNPEASANAFTADGFLHTGDLGILDKEGNIFIKGRSKNMILSANGQNIYPEEVEAVINSQSYVAESVVVDRNSKLVALVYLDKDAIRRDGLDEEAVSDIPEKVRINSNRILPNYSQITKVEIVLEPFEKTPKMSIRRFLYK